MIAIPAPAKINLTLQVLGRRADGYHLLESLVAFASVHDVVSASDASTLSLAVDGPTSGDLAANLQGDNLVLRAARRLAEVAGIAAPRAALTLHKILPVAGGVGGGSADAAAALLALAKLWRLDLTDAALVDIALPLGADLPVCLASRASYMSGIGEKLAPAPAMPPLGILLANPGIALPTPEVFRALNGGFGPGSPLVYQASDAASLLAALQKGRNDLETPALRLAPVIGDLLAALRGLPGARLARMSGSGATCFALFDDEEAARAADGALRGTANGWWSAPGRLISGREEIAA